MNVFRNGELKKVRPCTSPTPYVREILSMKPDLLHVHAHHEYQYQVVIGVTFVATPDTELQALEAAKRQVNFVAYKDFISGLDKAMQLLLSGDIQKTAELIQQLRRMAIE